MSRKRPLLNFGNILPTNSCETLETVQRRVKGQATKSSVSCPTAIKDYNKHMGGVDLHDRLVTT